MAILLWLLPAVLATFAAMAVVGWVGREPTQSERRREQQQARAQQRFARAMERPQPTNVRVRPPRDRSTGVTVRPARPSEGRLRDSA